MKQSTLPLNEFLDQSGVIIDVRSPGEFDQGHLPNAQNLPLFTNDERAIVGTLYKQVGHDEAYMEGLRIVGPKLAYLVESAKKWTNGKLAKVHCWRGGMRSQALTQLLNWSGIRTITLEGGYKAYRNWALKQTKSPRKIVILGGLTGSGKTHILHALKKKGEQILDLEDLACHKGSAYGRMYERKAPSNEQFENDLAWIYSQSNPNKTLWIEDESQRVGNCFIPHDLYQQMQNAPLIQICRPKEERIALLKKDYSKHSKTPIIQATLRIQKRLGSERCKHLIQAIKEDKASDAIILALEYYDKSYQASLKRRTNVQKSINAHGWNEDTWADALIEETKNKAATTFH